MSIEYNLILEIKYRAIVEQQKSNFEQLLSNKYRVSNNLSNNNKIERKRKKVNKF